MTEDGGRRTVPPHLYPLPGGERKESRSSGLWKGEEREQVIRALEGRGKRSGHQGSGGERKEIRSSGFRRGDAFFLCSLSPWGEG
jgi:hypothetical protein